MSKVRDEETNFKPMGNKVHEYRLDSEPDKIYEIYEVNCSLQENFL